MCLTFIPFALNATAYGNEWIQLDKSNYDPGEKMGITVKGITQQMVNDEACIGIFLKDLSDFAEVRGWNTLLETGEYVFDRYDIIAPTEPGEYVLALLRKRPDYGRVDYFAANPAEYLLGSLLFTVGGAAKDGQISLDKAAYTAMETITVTYSGITQKMINSNAVVAIIDKANPINSYGANKVSLGSGTITTSAPNRNGEFEMRLYSVSVNNAHTADSLVMSVPFTVSGASNTSGWAQEQNIAEKAAEYGLIPDSLKGADWTKPITRAEFAAVSVKLYENLTGKKATPAATNPFTDTKDSEILKAFNIGVTNGTSATKFSPNDLLNREQAATMLTRALKTAYIPGWTLPTDGNYTLNFTMPAKFTDDAKISDWAKPSVYFMVANKIINGMGDNMFGPKNVTDREIAMGYANATREQALAIAVRMVENLKDKPVNFQQGR